jgi:hypothetical protein
VRQVCEEEGIPYTAVSFLRTNRILVRHLHSVSRARPLELAAT